MSHETEPDGGTEDQLESSEVESSSESSISEDVESFSFPSDEERASEAESDESISLAPEPPKDATEQELENLVFGDEEGFREEVHRFASQTAPDHNAYRDDDALAGIQDSELFFLDEGPVQPNASANLERDDAARDGEAHGKPAWEDSDDERMNISLMAVPRLRKLRDFEGEDVISGREYTRRLRRQYLVLQPTPQWAKWDARASSKQRRASTNGANGDATDGDASDSDVDMTDDDDEQYSAQPLAKLLRSTQNFTRSSQPSSKKRIKLRPEVIAIERMKDIGPTQPHSITCLSIHPALPIILSAGLSSTLFLHHLRPRPTPPDPANPLITSLHLKHSPLSSAAFSPRPTTDTVSTTDPKIYLSSRRRYFHTWTLPTGEIAKTTRVTGEQATTQRSFEVLKPSPCGRYIALLGSTRKRGGVINILDSGTAHWIAQARIESRKGLADFAWWQDGRGLCIAGRDGEVSEWSMDERKVLHRWIDEGQVGATVVSLGGTMPDLARRKKNAPPPVLGPNRYVATGSTSGVVNIYDRGAWLSGAEHTLPANPKPLRTLSNLVTPISHIAFSPDGQIMAMSSRWKRDALRLVHLPTCAVYKNWPTSKTPLGRISATALGEWTDHAASDQEDGGGRRGLVLVVGNEQGMLRGWEITG